MARRRRLDADTRVRVMQHEAYRTIARKHPYAVIFGPIVARLVALAVIVLGLMAAWMYVPHGLLGKLSLFLGGLILITWFVWRVNTNGLQARMMARARGEASRPGLGLGWAVAASVALLGGLGWLSLWSPYA